MGATLRLGQACFSCLVNLSVWEVRVYQDTLRFAYLNTVRYAKSKRATRHYPFKWFLQQPQGLPFTILRKIGSIRVMYYNGL